MATKNFTSARRGLHGLVRSLSSALKGFNAKVARKGKINGSSKKKKKVDFWLG